MTDAREIKTSQREQEQEDKRVFARAEKLLLSLNVNTSCETQANVNSVLLTGHDVDSGFVVARSSATASGLSAAEVGLEHQRDHDLMVLVRKQEREKRRQIKPKSNINKSKSTSV